MRRTWSQLFSFIWITKTMEKEYSSDNELDNWEDWLEMDNAQAEQRTREQAEIN